MKIDNPIYFEYTNAAVPVIKELEPTSISPNDKSYIETPNLFARYFMFDKNHTLRDNLTEASSHEYYVLEGSGKTIIKKNNEKHEIFWKKGDAFIIPYTSYTVTHISFENNTLFFTCDDNPLLKYLHSKPVESRFNIVHYKHSDMMDNIKKFNSEKDAGKRNRNGILLTNNQMVDEKLNTLTHTMWSLLNSINANTVQKAHRHNSIAIDLCIDVDEEASNKGLVYTLMGKTLDDNNNIVDPIKMVWKKNCTFTTPPGWWHSHHNESDKPAWVFPVQDAGLHTYMRTLNIQFS